MNFDINKLIDTMEKQLGNFATTAFIAFFFFVIVAWGFKFVFSDVFLPLLSGLEGINITEINSWSVLHAFIIFLLFLCVCGLFYVLINAGSIARKKSGELREMGDTLRDWMKQFEDRRKKLNEIQEMWEGLKKGEKEFDALNKQLNDLLSKMERGADELMKAKEEFEEERKEHRKQ